MRTNDTVVAVVTDLMFQSRLREQAATLGRAFVVGDSVEAALEALDARPALAVVDLHVREFDWRPVVSAAKERSVPVLAFGRHTEAALLSEARRAGCDRVVARSTLVEELPELIEELASAAK